MARYDSSRKLDRNKALLEYWQAHPEASLTEIGKIFGGISKQRVSQIIQTFLNNREAERWRYTNGQTSTVIH